MTEQQMENKHRYYIDTKKYLKKYNQERWKRVCEARKKAMQEYYARNKELYARDQAIIREVRLAKGWSLKRLGKEIGRTGGSVSHYETGRVKAPWEDLYNAMPELKETRENEEKAHRN